MTIMEEKHGFEASKMAYKKKLGRWNATKRQRQHHAHLHRRGEESRDSSMEASTSESGGVSQTMPDVYEEDAERTPQAHGEHPRGARGAAEGDSSATKNGDDDADGGRLQQPLPHDTLTLQPSSLPSNQDDAEESADPLLEQVCAQFFPGSPIPPRRLTLQTLDTIFASYLLQHKDLQALMRLRSLYNFLLPSSTDHARLARTLYFCRLAAEQIPHPQPQSSPSTAPGTSQAADHAFLFTRTVGKATEQNTSYQIPAWGSPNVVESATSFWAAGYMDDTTLLDLLAKISGYFARDEPGLWPAMRPYFCVAKHCGADANDRYEKVILFCWDRMLGAISDRVGSLQATTTTTTTMPLSDEEDRFVTRAFMLLWAQQQSSKTFMFTQGSTMLQLLDCITHTNNTHATQSSAFHAIILACIVIQGYMRKADCPGGRTDFISAQIDGISSRIAGVARLYLDEDRIACPRLRRPAKIELLKDQLQYARHMLGGLAKTVRNRLVFIEEDLDGCALAFKARFAKMAWDIGCAVEDRGFSSEDLQTYWEPGSVCERRRRPPPSEPEVVRPVNLGAAGSSTLG